MKLDFAKNIVDKTKNDYNLISNDFSRTRGNIWEEIRFLFDDYLKKGDNVLDLGSGNGRYYNLIKENNASYIGIDNSEKLIQIAKNKYPEADFRVVDALNLPFADNSFDKIYSIAVLHHIPSTEFRIQFLKQAQRVLKENGLMIITVWKFSFLKEMSLLFKYTILKMIGKSKMDYRDILESWSNKIDRYYHLFSKRELVELAKEVGFKIKEMGITKNQRGNRQNIYLIVEK
ncbi:MAG: methyltransferase domain-containing protein [Candidatus Nealsonbacteria bacterium]